MAEPLIYLSKQDHLTRWSYLADGQLSKPLESTSIPSWQCFQKFNSQNLSFHRFTKSFLHGNQSPRLSKHSERAGRGDVERSARRKKMGNKGGGRSLLFWIEVSFLDCLCLGLIFLWCGENFRRHEKVIFSPVRRRKTQLCPLRRWGYPS